MQGWRGTMEDEHIVSLNLGPNKNTHIFGVMDGHGGVEVAKYIKNHFVDIFINSKLYKDNLIIQAIKETYKEINLGLTSVPAFKELTKYHLEFQKQYNLEQTEEEKESMQKKGYIENLAYEIGSTCNIVVIQENDIYYANCGDSRSVLLRHGEAIPMSTDHKPELPNEFKRIRRSGSIIKDGRVNGVLNLSRSIGDLQFKRGNLEAKWAVSCVPDVLNETITPLDDFIVIGCDGVWECISNEQMANFVYSRFRNGQNNLEQILTELLQKNVAVNSEADIGCDNMTCMIIKFKKESK